MIAFVKVRLNLDGIHLIVETLELKQAFDLSSLVIKVTLSFQLLLLGSFSFFLMVGGYHHLVFVSIIMPREGQTNDAGIIVLKDAFSRIMFFC